MLIEEVQTCEGDTGMKTTVCAAFKTELRKFRLVVAMRQNHMLAEC